MGASIRRPLLGALAPVEEPSTVSIPDACIATNCGVFDQFVGHKTYRAHSGSPTFRGPSISSFERDCPPRAMNADIEPCAVVARRRNSAEPRPPRASRRLSGLQIRLADR